MAEHEIWLDDARGRRLKLIDHYESFTATRIANDIGSCSLVLPTLYDDYISLDGMIEIWRKPEGGAMSLHNVYFTRLWEYAHDNGRDWTIIGGVDAMDLLNRRIVAYAAGSSNAQATGDAATMLRDVVNQNSSTDATDTTRSMNSLGFAVSPDSSTGAIIYMAYAYRNQLQLCKDIVDASRTAGTRLYFYITPYSATDDTMAFTLNVKSWQIGIDHSGTDMVTFGPAWGNMSAAYFAADYFDERSVVYSGGQGEGTARIVEEVSDTARAEASPWNRSEAFYNCSGQASDTDQAYSAGQAKLMQYRPKLSFKGTLRETPACRYGIDWAFGDKVIVEYRGYTGIAVITSIRLSLDGKGVENIDAGFEVVKDLTVDGVIVEDV